MTTSRVEILPRIIEESDDDISRSGIITANNIDDKEDELISIINSYNTDYDESYKSPGWFTVLSTFLVLFYTLGIVFSFGNFQQLYVDEVYRGLVSEFEITFIGGLATACLLSSGLYILPLIRRWGHRIIMLAGTMICPLGLILASVCTQVYQIYLCQGIVYGLGAGLIFSSVIVLPSPWFSRHRCLALGMAFSGAGFGPVLFGPITNLWNSQIGYRQCLRVLGGMGYFILGMATLLVKIHPSLIIKNTKQKKEVKEKEKRNDHQNISLSSPSPSSSSISLFIKKIKRIIQSCKNINQHYFILLLYSFLVTFGYTYPYFAVPTYAQNILYINSTNSSLLISLMSLLNGVSRILIGFIGDQIGAMNALFICTFISGLSSSLIWQFSSDFRIYIVYCILVGFFSGTFTSLLPIIVSDIMGKNSYQKYVGICYTATLFGNLFGAAISSLLQEKYGWLSSIQFIGSITLLSSLVILILRFLRTGHIIYTKV
ncbi:unnamed protein product [Cunninghamella blakesleeana]